MLTEIINTGSELMLGRVLNTHQQWLCSHLADLGCVVSRQVAVPDAGADIQTAVRESLGRAHLVLVTGGLGPTSDDLTRDLIADLLRKPLHEDPSVLAHIQRFFAGRRRPMPQRTRVQALVPEGALVLENPHGTAPGLAMLLKPNPFNPHIEKTWVIMLPGPPRELRPMVLERVIPLLRREFPLQSRFACRTLRSIGIGESVVEERISGPMKRFLEEGIEIGYCARPGQVDVRLTASSPAALSAMPEAEETVRKILGDSVYCESDDSLEAVVVRLLTERKKTLALAESCTGGFIAHEVTNVPGASAVLLAGIVAYSNAAKEQFLGVNPAVIASHGAVSEQVAGEMSANLRRRTGADYAVSVTGIAGPGGGTPEKPVGTVYIGLSSASGTEVRSRLNAWDRQTFKEVTAHQVLDWLRCLLLGKNAMPTK